MTEAPQQSHASKMAAKREEKRRNEQHATCCITYYTRNLLSPSAGWTHCNKCGEPLHYTFTFRKDETMTTKTTTTDNGFAVEHLDVAAISPDNRNPGASRITAATTKALAEEIQEDGLQQPIKVRPLDEGKGKHRRFLIIFGERRWRAFKHLKLKTIPAIVDDVDDLEALKIMNVENAQRIDLDYIAKGKAIAAMVANGLKVTEAAKLYGVSQGEASNAMRVSEIPEPMRSAVAKGEFPPTWARECLGVAEAPAVLEEVLRDATNPDTFSPVTCREHVIDAIQEYSRELLRPLTREDSEKANLGKYSSELNKRIDGPLFEIDDKLRAQLKVVKVKLPAPTSHRGKAKPIELELASNHELWDKQQQLEIAKQAFINKVQAGAKAKNPAGDTKAKLVSGKETVAKAKEELEKARAKKATPAATKKAKELEAKLVQAEKDAKKAEAADKRRRRKEADKKLGERAEELRLEWIRWEISEALDEPAVYQIMAWLVMKHPFKAYGGTSACDLIGQVTKDLGGKYTKPTSTWEHPGRDEWKTIASIPAEDSYSHLTAIVTEALWREGELLKMPANMVADLAQAREIDLEDGWRGADVQPGNEERGEFVRRFLELHTAEQLADLAKEIAPQLVDCPAKKADAVEVLAKLQDKKFPTLLKAPAGPGRPKRKS